MNAPPAISEPPEDPTIPMLRDRPNLDADLVRSARQPPAEAPQAAPQSAVPAVPAYGYTQRAKAIGDRVMDIRPPRRPEAPKAQSANRPDDSGVDLKPSAPTFDSPDVDLKRSSPIFDSQPVDASIAAASGSSDLTAAAIPPASRTTSAARSDQPDASQPPPTEDSTPPRKRRLPNFLRFLGANRP